MSLARCKTCFQIIDTDDFNAYPFAYRKDLPDKQQDECICEDCQSDLEDQASFGGAFKPLYKGVNGGAS